MQQNSGVGAGFPLWNRDNMDPDPDLRRARNLTEEKIFEIVQERMLQPVDDAAKIRAKDFAKRVEEGLFKISTTKEEYMNLDTLNSRLQAMIKRIKEQRNPQQSVNSSSAIGTMIPTSGMSNSGNPNLMATSNGGGATSAAHPMIPTSGMSNSGNPNLMATSNGGGATSAAHPMIPTPGIIVPMIPTSGMSNSGNPNLMATSNVGGDTSAPHPSETASNAGSATSSESTWATDPSLESDSSGVSMPSQLDFSDTASSDADSIAPTTPDRES